MIQEHWYMCTEKQDKNSKKENLQDKPLGPCVTVIFTKVKGLLGPPCHFQHPLPMVKSLWQHLLNCCSEFFRWWYWGSVQVCVICVRKPLSFGFFPCFHLFLGIFLLPAALITADSPSRSAAVGSAHHGNDEKLVFWCEHSTLYDINAGAQLVLSTLDSHSFHPTHIRRRTCVRTCSECSFKELDGVWPHWCVCAIDSVHNIVSYCASSGCPSFFWVFGTDLDRHFYPATCSTFTLNYLLKRTTVQQCCFAL